VLDFDEKLDERAREKLCSSFAGAFLLPQNPFIEEWGMRRSNVSMEELKFIDEYYGISVQAIVARAKFLNLVSEHTYRQFNIWLNSHGFRKHEFGDFRSKESPGRFKRLLHRAVSEEIITMSKAAALDNSNLEEFMMEYQSVG
jgi:Zn-dependent peptidase ImmA (M78 family)